MLRDCECIARMAALRAASDFVAMSFVIAVMAFPGAGGCKAHSLGCHAPTVGHVRYVVIKRQLGMY